MCVVITHSAEVKVWDGDRGRETEDNELFQPFLYHTMRLSDSIILPMFISLVHS